MKFEFELTGEMPLIMHKDDIMEADRLDRWRKEPANKNFSVPGDDRSPAWGWQCSVYHDGEYVAMPSENIMVAIRSAGSKLTLKRMTTFKQISQTGILIDSEYCEFSTCGKPIKWADIKKMENLTFDQQAAAVEQLGFSLFLKRAKIGGSKHIRVRPRFDVWTVKGTLKVLAPEITQEILTTLMELSGRSGLGDWRPTAPKAPGPYGQYSVKLKRL